ncbi:MAG: cytochrome b [Hyphomicrobiales bacterium]|nr:cytochrome b [Hyphomicrobiales bacterium]
MNVSNASMSGRRTSYSATSKWLHWIVAIIVIGMIPAGIIMSKLPKGPEKLMIFGYHTEFGVLVLLLVIWRFLTRLGHGTPAPVATLSAFERIASTSATHLLYLLLLAMPLIGWLAVSALGGHIEFFGLFQLPALMPKNPAVGKILLAAHKIGGISILVLVSAHILAALYHGLVKHDGVFSRMWPGGEA